VDPEFFEELTAENRTVKGWIRTPGTRNEAFDLHVYNRAACIILKAEAINWSAPPSWAAPFAARREPLAPVTPIAARRRRTLDPGI
jgi:phage terminase large subunit GpA-like protein